MIEILNVKNEIDKENKNELRIENRSKTENRMKIENKLKNENRRKSGYELKSENMTKGNRVEVDKLKSEEEDEEEVDNVEKEKSEKEKEDLQDGKIKEYGQTTLVNEERKSKIHLLSIIGEIEGHECLPQHNKTTKYEHVLPQLAAIEDSTDIDGLLILINTVGGDVEAGLAISEMIASLSKPTVSLVLGGSHSIGVPLAVSSDYSFIVPTATMIIHPVRMNGMVIGVAQTFDYLQRIQERILSFIVDHSSISKEELKALMLDTMQLAKDVGSILVGSEAVDAGIINEVGGIQDAFNKLYSMIDENSELEDELEEGKTVKRQTKNKINRKDEKEKDNKKVNNLEKKNSKIEKK